MGVNMQLNIPQYINFTLYLYSVFRIIDYIELNGINNILCIGSYKNAIYSTFDIYLYSDVYLHSFTFVFICYVVFL